MFHFAVLGQYKKLEGGKARAKKRDAIACEVGGSGWGYIYYRDSARHQIIGYGYGPNMGEPFGSRISAEILAAWERAGV